MIALTVSYFIITYLLIPRAFFRVAGLFLPLRFQRTRTEEVTFAIKISLVPLFLSVMLGLACRGWPMGQIVADSKTVFAASYSETAFNRAPQDFWNSLGNVMVAQLKFIEFYYPLVWIEAAVFVLLVSNYGNWRGKSRSYEWFVQRLLLRGVNEWYLLLTVANFPSKPARQVKADVLTAEDHLYEGEVAEYFTDNDGGLSGLSLVNPRRFDRVGYLRAKEREATNESRSEETTEPKSYWKPVPGQAMYLPREKILSLNLRYPVEPIEDAENATQRLRVSGIQLKVEIQLGPHAGDSESKPES